MTQTQAELDAYHLAIQKDEIAKMIAHAEPYTITLTGMKLSVLPGVYPGGIDSELMCKATRDIVGGKRVLDLCTGTGVIALHAARHGAKEVVAVDLNPAAVQTGELNKKRLGLKNVTFLEGALFEPVAGQTFDVIIINPPYTDKKPANKTEICFWDDHNDTTRKFFAHYKPYLNPGGHVFVGWADFSSMDLIRQLAEQADTTLRLAESQSTPSGLATFFAYEVTPKTHPYVVLSVGSTTHKNRVI